MPLHPLQTTWDDDLTGGDPLGFPGYVAPAARDDTVITGRTATYAFIEGRFDVLGGSMGAVHGERVARAYARAVDEGLAMVVRPASGGARMQEGMVALIQMARTSAAAAAHSAAGLLSVAVLQHPTTGGVYASYGSLADITAAIEGATVGFAGPRVVQQLTGKDVRGRSHTASTAHAAGLVDAVITADDELAWVEAALGLRDVPLGLAMPRGSATEHRNGGAWGEVVAARDPARPSGIHHAGAMCSSWTELASIDPVVRAALAAIEGRRVVVVATDRHGGTGRPRPEGFRLVRRAAALAGRLRLPLVTFVDTPGAEPGPESENGGIAREIALTFAAMAALPTASVSVCVGEGGSGGALAIAHADRLLIQEHAIFSVIGPEGAAAILLRDAGKAPEVAPLLKLTAPDLLELGIVDAVVPETAGALARAVADALAGAVPGDRQRRVDAATARWVR